VQGCIRAGEASSYPPFLVEGRYSTKFQRTQRTHFIKSDRRRRTNAGRAESVVLYPSVCVLSLLSTFGANHSLCVRIYVRLVFFQDVVLFNLIPFSGGILITVDVRALIEHESATRPER